MKKLIYLPLLLLTLFVSVNKVSADTHNVYITDYYHFYGDYKDLDTSIVSNLITYWNNSLSSSYPYYMIYFSGNDAYSSCSNTSNFNCRQRLTLRASSTNTLFYYDMGQSNANTGFKLNNNATYSYYCYNFLDGTFSSSLCNLSYGDNYLPYSSNVDYTFVNSNHCSASIPERCADQITLPLYSNLDIGVSLPQYSLLQGYVVPTYVSLSSNTYIPNPSDPNSGGNGINISDMFTNPIQALQSVWTSIVSIFNLIGEFIALIPSPLREFLIASFMLAIILGILKIIL